jgi:hypothetical protein
LHRARGQNFGIDNCILWIENFGGSGTEATVLGSVGGSREKSGRDTNDTSELDEKLSTRRFSGEARCCCRYMMLVEKGSTRRRVVSLNHKRRRLISRFLKALTAEKGFLWSKGRGRSHNDGSKGSKLHGQMIEDGDGEKSER